MKHYFFGAESDHQARQQPLNPEVPNVPTHGEIRQQLDRLLISKRFAGAPNQARVLSFMVDRALKGETEIEQSTIAFEFFPSVPPDDSTNVRVTLHHLRKKLRAYYAQEGLQDRVVISLPEPQRSGGMNVPTGTANTPVFAYNPRLTEDREHPACQALAPEPFVSATKAAQFVDINRNLSSILHHALVLTCAATALRASEILALRWSDILWDEARIRVSKRWANGQDGRTKTDASDGYVPLHPLLAQHLRDWHARSPHSRNGDFVFPSLKCKGKVPVSAGIFVADYLRPAAQNAGVAIADGQRFGLHNLRHSLSN